jgi:NAD dependent epimerase/dehydratase
MLLNNKNVLITGAGGFIGSHLVEECLAHGCKVRAFVHYNSFNTWGWLDSLSEETRNRINVVAGDIRDSNFVESSVKDMDILFHLAALISIPFSYHAPDSYVESNIKGTLNILQAARKAKSQRVLVTSTSEVYGTAQYIPIDENHPCRGQSPYSASKIGADRMAESFYRSFEVPVTIVRPFNTYGPRQSARAIIPTIITQLLAGRTEIQLGSLTPERDFNYVKDICRGFCEVAQSERTIGEEVNIAAEKAVSMKVLAETLITFIAPHSTVVREKKRVRPEKSEVMKLLGCNQKIRELTGWKPSYTLKQGLLETIAWFKENLHRYKPDQYNV